MNMVNHWNGLNGTYEVPDAIIWLADKAQSAAGLPTLGHMINGPSPDPMSVLYGRAKSKWQAIEASPAWRIIAEWGNWRDNEFQPAREQFEVK